MNYNNPIEVSNLSHSFGKGDLKKQILFDITTEIPKGEIVIVTGPSGSGKTTLLTLVGALRSSQEGSIKVLGEELCGAKAKTLEKAKLILRTLPFHQPPPVRSCTITPIFLMRLT